jgi:phytoene dehydrogenase-like protein
LTAGRAPGENGGAAREDDVGAAYDAIVVGAGHNGLTAAAYLARAGLRTLVLERRAQVGGASATEEVWPGFKLQTAAYTYSLMRPVVVRELELARHGLEVIAYDPSLFLPFPDGRYLCLWSDHARTLAEIARFSRKDAEAWERVEALFSRIARFVEPLLDQPPPDLTSLHPRDLFGLLKLAARARGLGSRDLYACVRLLQQSAADFLDEHFESEQVKVALGLFSIIGTYGGPRTPGTAYVLLHHVMGTAAGNVGASVWGFVRGGMGMVGEAIAGAARAAGAEIRTGVSVERILVEGGRATGVALATGEEIRAARVLSNADPKRTFLTLVEERELPPEFVTAVQHFRSEGTSAKVNLVLSELPDWKAVPGTEVGFQHRGVMDIAPSLDYLERAWDECKYGWYSGRPYCDIAIPSVHDASLCPPGYHSCSVFVQYAPYHLRESSWEAEREKLGDVVIDTIAEYAPNIRDAIVHRQVLSPWDLEQRFGLTHGNIFHGEITPDQILFLRPVPGWARYRTPVPGLYLCGAGTHPGGGVMGACGRNAAREVLRDARLRLR